MTFTSDTLVQSSEGWKQVQDYAKGDVISVASSGAAGWTWAPSTVADIFDGQPQTQRAVYLKFAGDGELIVSVDQPMMIRGGVLKPAGELAPETDSLMGSDGALLPVTSVMLGEFSGRFYAVVATSDQWQGTADGHLLNCAGVICGDYLVQVHLGADANAA